MDFFVDVVDGHLVHGVEVRHDRIAKLDTRGSPGEAWVLFSVRRDLTVCQHRFERFPPGE